MTAIVVTLVTKARSFYLFFHFFRSKWRWESRVMPRSFKPGEEPHGGHWNGGIFGRRAGVGSLERRKGFFGLLWRHKWSSVMLGPSRKSCSISIISVSYAFLDNRVDLSVSATLVLGQELGQLWSLRAHFPAALARLWHTSSMVTICSPQDLGVGGSPHRPIFLFYCSYKFEDFVLGWPFFEYCFCNRPPDCLPVILCALCS